MGRGLEEFNKPQEEMINVGIDPNDPRAVVQLPLKELKPFIEMYLKYTPKQLVLHIEDQFIICKGQKVKRTDVAWGVWSAAMNIATRQRVKDKDSESDKLELTFQYWQRVSELLDLYFYRKKWFGAVKIKQKKRQIKEIRRLIV